MAMQSEDVKTYKELLKRTKREMIRRHQKHLRRSKKGNDETKASDSEGDDDDVVGANGSENDVDKDGQEFAEKFVEGAGDDDDPNSERVNIIREPRPQAGNEPDDQETDSLWNHRTAEENFSAAGAAPPAIDRVLASKGNIDANVNERDRYFGVLLNPKGFPWVEQECNVHHGEEGRLKDLIEQWYGKASVGDGADIVERHELDPWQKFAHDIVMNVGKKRVGKPLRMMLLGTAGTGKSRTVRSFVHARRLEEQDRYAEDVRKAELSYNVALE